MWGRIAKAIVEQHGGRISFQTAVDRGTSFYVDLPLRAGVAETSKKSGPRILVVEDDPDIACIVRAMLKGAADVGLADSLASARDQLGRGDYALVFLDIGLPDGSGLDLLPVLNAEDPPIPVLVFSAQEVDEEIRDQVAAAFVKSRTDEARLVRAIRSSLDASGVASDEQSPPG